MSTTTTDDQLAEVRRRIDGLQAFAQIGTAATTTFSNTGLTAGTSYTYRVRAFNVTGNSPYSNVVRKRTL